MANVEAKLKIGLIGPVPPPSGGMAMQTLQLKRLLEQRGHTVKLIAVNMPYSPAWVGNIPLVRAAFRLLRYKRTLHHLVPKQDVIHLMANSGWSFHLFARPAVAIANQYNVPLVLNYRGGGARTFFEKSWQRIQQVFKRTHKVLVPSGFLQEVFADFGQSSQIVPNIVDLKVFGHKTPDLKKNGLVVILTRNLEPLYDNATAIRAFKLFRDRFPDAVLKIAGSGPELCNLQNLVSELDLADSVQFLGRLDRDKVVALYTEADLMLNPSTVDNMPNSILEALASGTLVVSTNVGGIPYMVSHNESALLVSPGQPEQMMSAMTRLVDEPDLAQRLSKVGVELVSSYQPDKIVPQLECLYREALK